MGCIFSGNTEVGVFMLSVSEQEYEEFKQLVARATNTWDTMPPWVRTISDALADNPSTDIKHL